VKTEFQWELYVISRIRTRWRKVKKSPPGKRFQERYFRLQQKPNRKSVYRKVFNIILGVATIFLGIIFWFIPGPGWVIIFIGATLLSGESLILARALDWLEVNIRKLYAKLKSIRIINSKSTNLT
jgi:uncharacterized protein (TIGR02611 family)